MSAQTSEDRRQIAYLHTEPGLPGSGRLRYAAAMYLRQHDVLSDAALEIFRICAVRDRDDPMELLAAHGLEGEIPPGLSLSPADAVLDLLDAADRYLMTLDGPGIAEVRNGIATWRAAPAPAPATDNPVVTQYLPAALEALAESRPSLANAIAGAAPHLGWITYDEYPPEEVGADFRTSHAFASIIGEEALMPATDFDFGLFLIAPHVLYRDHLHRAPELYAPLTGPHGWRFDPAAPMTVKTAHEPVWNPSFTPHMTKVGPVPFLCLFGWTQDVSEHARIVPASDWAELEQLRLEG